jgi:hypothetical protein
MIFPPIIVHLILSRPNNYCLIKYNLSNIRTLFSKLVFERKGKFYPIPFQNIHVTSEFEYDVAELRVKHNNKIILFEKIDKKNHDVSYYENLYEDIDTRTFQNGITESFKLQTLKRFKNFDDLIFLKPYRGDVVVIRFFTNNVIDDNELYKLKEMIQGDLAIALSKESTKQHLYPSAVLGIVIELVDYQGMYKNIVYINKQGQDKSKSMWFEEDWQKVNLFEKSMTN